MINFLSIISDVLFVFLIVSSTIFGLSFAVKFYMIITVKKVVRESSKNLENIVRNEKISNCELAIKKHINKYVLHSKISKKNGSIRRANKVRKLFKIKQKDLIDNGESLKDISLSLIKSISSEFEGAGGYLNYSKNELIEMLKKLCVRLTAIFNSSGIIWLKTVKISSIVHVINLTKSIENLKGKTGLILASYFLDFCFFVSRFISPVGASKKLANNLLGDGLSSLIVSAVFNVVGKEWAVLCFEKERARLELKHDKKIA